MNYSHFYSNMASASAGEDPTCRKEDCSRFDVGLIYGTIARFSDAERFENLSRMSRSQMYSLISRNKIVENSVNSENSNKFGQFYSRGSRTPHILMVLSAYHVFLSK